jgi:hypothetical protein
MPDLISERLCVVDDRGNDAGQNADRKKCNDSIPFRHSIVTESVATAARKNPAGEKNDLGPVA